jgi:hypothetical protein
MIQAIRRPLWKAFTERKLLAAARHVRAGGHALVWAEGPAAPIAWMLLPCDPEGISDLAWMSMLAVGRRRYAIVRSAPAEGLALARVPRRHEAKVVRWCERDAGSSGAMQPIELDCTACAACCHHARVEIGIRDRGRWRRGGRGDLSAPRWLRRSEGKTVLRQREQTAACVHLEGTLCGIYELRPDACRAFVPGSEPCLSARRARFGDASNAGCA